jgi:hypothetical protein
VRGDGGRGDGGQVKAGTGEPRYQVNLHFALTLGNSYAHHLKTFKKNYNKG